MTADRVALEDKVVQMFKNGPDWAYSTRDIATAAIDLIRAEVLEEAAGMAEQDESDNEKERDTCEPNSTEWHVYHHGAGTARGIAAAIRALKDKP